MDPNAYEKKMAEEAQKQYVYIHADKWRNKDRLFWPKSWPLRPRKDVYRNASSYENQDSQAREGRWYRKLHH